MEKSQPLKTALIVFFVILATSGVLALILIESNSCSGSSTSSSSNISVISQDLKYDIFSERYYILAKVKNTASKSIKVSFYGRILRNGTVVEEGYSGVIYLNPGETGSTKGVYYSPAYVFVDDNYTFSIEKWNIYAA